MNYVSVCSGIEAATVAWHPLGWRPLLFAEIAKFPSRVLAHHWPGVRNVGDFTTITPEVLPPQADCNLLVGGTPCQAFSVAGLGGGLSDDRGNLALEFMRLADRLRARGLRWVLWENVPGVLSNDGGRAFGSILGALAELGFGWAYRVMDAQFFGVAQRRRRVFVVGYLGDYRRAAAVLFERSSMYRNTPKGREERAKASRAAESSARVRRAISVTGDIAHTLASEGADASEDGTGRGTPIVAIPFDTTQITHRENRSRPSPCDPSPTLARAAHPPAIAFHIRQTPITEEEEALPLEANGPCGVAVYGGGSRGPREIAPCLTTRVGGRFDFSTEAFCVENQWNVRRLTPRECERLQGFPDDYTLIDGAKDGPRCRALGNSMAVPVMRRLAERIAFADRLK